MNDQSEQPQQNPYQPPQSSDPLDEPVPKSAMGAVTARFMRLLGDRGSVLTGIWALVALFNLGMFALSAAIQFKTGVMPFSLDMMQDPEAMQRLAAQQNNQVNLLGLLIYPLAWVSGALYYAGFRPMRLIEADGRHDLGFSEARQEMFSRFGPVLGVVFFYFLAMGIGMACCLVPGLIAAVVFLPAPYMVAALGQGIFPSLSNAFDWLKRHWLLLGVACGVSALIGIFSAVVSFVSLPVMVGIFGDVGVFIANLTLWLLSSIVGYFGWLFTGSVFVTIDLAEERFFGSR